MKCSRRLVGPNWPLQSKKTLWRGHSCGVFRAVQWIIYSQKVSYLEEGWKIHHTTSCQSANCRISPSSLEAVPTFQNSPWVYLLHHAKTSCCCYSFSPWDSTKGLCQPGCYSTNPISMFQFQVVDRLSTRAASKSFRPEWQLLHNGGGWPRGSRLLALCCYCSCGLWLDLGPP